MFAEFPYIPLSISLVALRVGTALLFMAHAITRIFNGTIPRFAEFMANQGFLYPTAVVWGITLYEIVAGSLIIIGYKTRYMVIGLFLIAFVGIILIHRHQGWFVGEHGTGGSEYSVLLMLALFVMMAADNAGADRVQWSRT